MILDQNQMLWENKQALQQGFLLAVPKQSIPKTRNYMGGVDSMDQLKSAYQLDRRSKFRFYPRLFLDLLNVACVNTFIVYKKVRKYTAYSKIF